MLEVPIQLAAQPDGSVVISGGGDGGAWRHDAGAAEVAALQQVVARLLDGFESDTRPLADPVALSQLGTLLRDTYLAPLTAAADRPLEQAEGRLHFVSSSSACLNLPWELLPGRDGRFLLADGRWAVRRSVRAELPETGPPLVARPLRILFAACAPQQPGMPVLDYEREEEAILRIADRLGGRIYLDIAEAGTFDELQDLISEYHPHVVHLSGHGVLNDGVGRFCFEDERGRLDARDGLEIAERLFAGSGVRLVFVSGCQSARAGVAGLCQSLTAGGHAPLAIGWGASIADDRATQFARDLYHELAAGQGVDRAVSAARRNLLEQGRTKIGGVDALDASFALPQVYATASIDQLLDEGLPPQRPERPGVRYELLGDDIRGLRSGFVGRRRVLQRTRPALRSGERTVVLLTGIGGAGKSTLATRLANRCKQDGYRVVALQARREEAPLFCLRLLDELAAACQRLGRDVDERMLRDGQRPVAERLRLAVEVLNESRVLLVLDNLESLMPVPPAAPVWQDADFAHFYRELTRRLTGEGRALLTCRYVPLVGPGRRTAPDGSPLPMPVPSGGGDPLGPNVAHEPLPDFTEADFFKYLRRHDAVAVRIERGQLPRTLLAEFHRKLGGTPRFVEQAAAVLGRIDPDALREQLEDVAEPADDADVDDVRRLQQTYFRDLFLPQLYQALSAEHQRGLSRLALSALPLPLDGVARAAALGDADSAQAAAAWLALGLVQRLGEPDDRPLCAVYPLQREMLTDPARLDEAAARATHAALAEFWQECYERDRERELGLTIEVELLACLEHAEAAGDADRRRWAVGKLCWQLIRRAEYAAAQELVAPLLAHDRHPDLLQIAARLALDTGDWKESRVLGQEAQRALQAIGDRAGEAATLYQIGAVAWKCGRREVAIRLVATCFAIESAMGSGGVRETLQGLLPMAQALEMDETGLQSLLQEAAQQYHRDRGAAWVAAAGADA